MAKDSVCNDEPDAIAGDEGGGAARDGPAVSGDPSGTSCHVSASSSRVLRYFSESSIFWLPDRSLPWQNSGANLIPEPISRNISNFCGSGQSELVSL